MRLAWLVLSAFIVTVLAACQQAPATSTSPAVDLIERPNRPATVSLLTLARNPSAFVGETLILSGAYQPLPLPVCTEQSHPSPATWALRDNDVDILVSGFDSALRSLAAPGQRLEVEGRWQKWEGPVGCGRRAPTQTFWYLQLASILSPNPLVASIETPSEQLSPSTQTPTLPVIAGDEPLTPTPPAVPAVTENATGAAPTATPTLPGQPSPLPPAATAIATVTPFPTFTAIPTTPVTGTVTVGTETPAPTMTATETGDLTPTPTIDSGGPVNASYDRISKRAIVAGGIHEWRFSGAIDVPIIVDVAPANGLNVALELLDPAGNRLIIADRGGAGQIESIDQTSLPQAGMYTIEVSSVGQTAGNYALLLQSESSEPIMQFQGSIAYGQTKSGASPAGIDHLWNFEGLAGDRVQVIAGATTSTDLRIHLINHNGQEVEVVDDNSEYSPPADREETSIYTLPAAGFYTIRLGEVDLGAQSYTFRLERVS